MVRNHVIISIVLWCGVWSCTGCKQQPASLRGHFRNYNLLLISIDTLRADYVGSYGTRHLTPAVDALAARSFLFESMFTTSSTTLPAHFSLMTGCYPRDLRNGYAVQDSATTMAEVLGRHGYSCLAVVSALPLDKRFNMQQGFSYYDSDFSSCRGSVTLRDSTWFSHRYTVFDCNAQETTSRALTLLKSQGPDAPFFLWVHYYDPHLPYTPPAGLYDSGKISRRDFPYSFNPTRSDLDSLQELYSGEVRFVDAQIQRLIEGVSGLYDPAATIIVVVSDHGENLYEHDGYLDHSKVVYDTVMWIPCLIHLPGIAGRRVGDLASIIDVMPTLLDVLGIPVEGGEGTSLAPLMEAAAPLPVRSYVTCETNDFGLKEEEQAIAVRTKSMKYIYNNWMQGGDLFFAMRDDTRERRPLISAGGDEAGELTRVYREWRKRYKSGKVSRPLTLDATTEEALKSLGYLQ